LASVSTLAHGSALSWASVTAAKWADKSAGARAAASALC
jgi:hypothetical protein